MSQGPQIIQNLTGQEPIFLFGVAEFDETFVLDCYKDSPVSECVGRKACRHGAKAAKRCISGEYVAICTGIQRDGIIVAEAVNRAKPSGWDLDAVFCGHIAECALILTDGLNSYNILETLADEECRGMFHLNTVNGLLSYIKKTYNHYRSVTTKYINRYNALFSIAFRCADSLKDTLFVACATSDRIAIGTV